MVSGEAFPLAIVSIFLYSAVALSSGYYYFKLERLKSKRIENGVFPSTYERYESPKKYFFLALMVSAALDVPMYIGCAARGGPTECQWDEITYPVVWCFHLLALIGYAYSIVIPPILWSDIVNKRDGILWRSAFPIDFTKRFFQLALTCYSLLMILTVILVIIYFRLSQHRSFQHSSALNGFSTFLEPILFFLLALGCLYSGVRLQMYVIQVKLSPKATMKFLTRLNVTMVTIVLTYCVRSLFVLRLFALMPPWYERTFACSYTAWVVCTRWLPFIMCSFLLIHQMRLSSSEIATIASSGGYDSILQANPADDELGLFERPSITKTREFFHLKSNGSARHSSHSYHNPLIGSGSEFTEDRGSVLSQLLQGSEQRSSSEHYYDKHVVASQGKGTTHTGSSIQGSDKLGHSNRFHSTESTGFFDCVMPPCDETISPHHSTERVSENL